MKIILNKCFGGFEVKKSVLKKLGYEYCFEVDRQDPVLIEMIEKYGSDYVSDSMSKLVVVEVPDSATDWEMDDYDSVESITYVVDGKLHHA